MSNSRGGKREGAGRKPLPVSERLRPVTVWLTQEQIDWLRKTPNGTMFLRELLASHIQRLKTQ